jgi:hypothetical protein
MTDCNGQKRTKRQTVVTKHYTENWHCIAQTKHYTENWHYTAQTKHYTENW